jgi:hypothetical protein
MKRSIVAAFLLLSISSANAQPANPVQGNVINTVTVNSSATITLGNTFQTVMAALASGLVRRSLTIQNNNATDICCLFIGSGTAAKGTSILLLAGQAYTRYWPNVPSDAFQATCANTNDTLYIDNQ